MKKGLCLLGGLAMVMGSAVAAFAGPPLTNVEGVGGVALNPMAYVANPICKGEKGFCNSSIAAEPQLGFWHVDMSESGINLDSIGANMSFYNRVEVGFAEQFVHVGELAESGTKRNLSAKLNLIQENQFLPKIMPAISIGVIRSNTDLGDASNGLPGSNNALFHTRNSGWDYYAVATKTIAAPLPVPMVLNAGVRSTRGWVLGTLGYGPSRDTIFFGNVEVVPLPHMIVGWEYEQGDDVGATKNTVTTPAIQDFHLAWMHKNMTLVAAYITAEKNQLIPGQLGLGNGWVFSAQFAF